MKIIDSMNAQFKLLELNGNYYLIDVDSNFLAFIFPMLIWRIPLKATRIDKALFNILREKKIKKINYVIYIIFGLIIGRILYDSSKSYFEDLNYSFSEKMFGLVIAIIVIMLVRILIAYKNKKSIFRKYSVRKENVSVCVEKESMKSYYVKQQYIRLIIFYCIALALIYTYLFISIDMMIVLVIGLVIFIFLNRYESIPYESKIMIKEGWLGNINDWKHCLKEGTKKLWF